jgi:hypothetical protein
VTVVGSRRDPRHDWKPVAASVTRPRMSLVLQPFLPFPHGCQGPSPHQQGRDARMIEQCFGGIDVSQDRLDVLLLPQATRFSVGNDEAGWNALIPRLRDLPVAAIGLEPSGGYERLFQDQLRRQEHQVRPIRGRPQPTIHQGPKALACSLRGRYSLRAPAPTESSIPAHSGRVLPNSLFQQSYAFTRCDDLARQFRPAEYGSHERPQSVIEGQVQITEAVGLPELHLLHRAELTKLERSAQIAEWIRLTDEWRAEQARYREEERAERVSSQLERNPCRTS